MACPYCVLYNVFLYICLLIQIAKQCHQNHPYPKEHGISQPKKC